ncbi:hypothetical protein RHS03_07870, partial [Rhizoctonia solani]
MLLQDQLDEFGGEKDKGGDKDKDKDKDRFNNLTTLDEDKFQLDANSALAPPKKGKSKGGSNAVSKSNMQPPGETFLS